MSQEEGERTTQVQHEPLHPHVANPDPQQQHQQQDSEQELLLKHDDAEDDTNHHNSNLNPPLVAATLIPEEDADEAMAEAVIEHTRSCAEPDPEAGHHMEPIASVVAHVQEGTTPPPTTTNTTAPVTTSSPATASQQDIASATASAVTAMPSTSGAPRQERRRSSSIRHQVVSLDEDTPAPEEETALNTESNNLDSSTNNANDSRRRMQPTPRLPQTIQQVHFDTFDEISIAPRSAPNSAGSTSTLSPMTTKSSRCWYRNTLAWSFLFFFIGCVFMAALGYLFSEIQPGDEGPITLEQGPTDGGPKTPSPSPPLAQPTLSDPRSSTPSAAPSCSGLFGSAWSQQISLSGTNHLTMSDDGTVLVVAHYEYEAQLHFLETFSLQSGGGAPMRQPEGYFILDMSVSGDGRTLVLGLSTFVGPDDTTVLGGAAVVLQQDQNKREWRPLQELVTGGGAYGKVSSVAVSYDGSTVAVVEGVPDHMGVQIFRKKPRPVDQLQNSTLAEDTWDRWTNVLTGINFLDSSSQVVLSGDGNRLFVATVDSSIHVLHYNETRHDWDVLDNNTIVLPNGCCGKSGVTTSHDGSLVLVSSELNKPVRVYEQYEASGRGGPWIWQAIASLDVLTSTREQQWMSVSRDGRNIVMCEVTSGNEKEALARFYHRAGNVFGPVQDLNLQTRGGIRAMELDEAGEQLTVAFTDDTVAAYRKDCGSSSANSTDTSSNP